MADLSQITELEQVYHRLSKMIAEMETLREFVLSRLPEKNKHGPKNSGMLDPRTGRPFRSKINPGGGTGVENNENQRIIVPIYFTNRFAIF